MKRTIAAALVLAFGAVGLTGCDDGPSQMEICLNAGGSWFNTIGGTRCEMPGCEGEEK